MYVCNTMRTYRDIHFVVTQKELKGINSSSFKEGDQIHVTDKHGAGLYTIFLKKHGYSSFRMGSTVMRDKNPEIWLNCTPGTRNGWPYYIADFLSR